MSEPKLISPMLDNFVMGDPISDIDGVRCCPAMEKDSDNRYIVKIISVPASSTQLDALLLSGAYSSQQDALAYFKDLASGIVEETKILEKLSVLEGFIPFRDCQIEPMEDDNGFDVYLLSAYHTTLQKYLRNHSMTHLDALNLGLDLCAALTVCRRSGYLYADLKPSNIYITPERGYRIGDLGFLNLNTLKYASLPERYRSQFTAPEIEDAYSALNTTIDIYALGLILYQVFNDGTLPTLTPDASFPAPANADYEMAEIILKACAPDPADRWQDPAEMGQAIVSYMQRNGAHNTPITPVPVSEASTEEEINSDEILADTDDKPGNYEAAPSDEASENAEDNHSESEAEVSAEQEEIETTEETDTEEVTEETIYTEDEEGNLTFINDSDEDETTLNEDAEQIEYHEVSEEVSDMLTQADEIIAHQAPEPVVQPEPIDVQIPPMPVDEENAEDASENTQDDAVVNDEVHDEATTEDEVTPPDDAPDHETVDEHDEEVSDDEDESNEEDGSPKKPRIHWVRSAVLILLAAALLFVGFYFYKNYYLQPIDAILLEDDDNGTLTVLVSTSLDEEKLSVVCSDTYGNQQTAPVKDGKAIFTGLAPNSAYTVKVVVNGFHKLTGDTSAAYTTPVMTNIVQFTAVTGSEEGSVILSFAIDGPDANQWRISYVADNGEFKETVFAGHTVTLNGFTVGNNYTFTLKPDSDLLIGGTTEATYTASKIVKAENLTITGCANNKLTVAWSVPEGSTIESWTVRCYSDNGFDSTIVATEPEASFDITDNDSGYTVEVTAAGMSVSERVFAEPNALNVTDFVANNEDPNTIGLSWKAAAVPTGGWKLRYSIEDGGEQEIVCTENHAQISPVVPGRTYDITLQTADGVNVLGGAQRYTANDAAKFEGYGITADNLEFFMCRTPSNSNWNRYDLGRYDYTTEFSVGENASFLVEMHASTNASEELVTTLFEICDESGALLDTCTSTETWNEMWSNSYCELDITKTPQTPGNYKVRIYFNAELAADIDFYVVA